MGNPIDGRNDTSQGPEARARDAASGSSGPTPTLDARQIGVGPYPQPWPCDPRLDPELLREGDRRNVVDAYRYWRLEAIVADLDARRHPFHVATENWQRDPNLGALVRNANAFAAACVHIVGRRSWNRRGAMMTERYQHIHHHRDLDALLASTKHLGLAVVGIDNVEGSRSLSSFELPRACLLIFGAEGPGLSPEARSVADALVHIPQFGSTRSINAGAASAIVMYEWCRRYASDPPPLDRR